MNTAGINTNASPSIAISRDGQEMGTWSAGSIAKMLAAGVLVPTDHFWREAMTEWDTLAALTPPPSSPAHGHCLHRRPPR